MMGTGKKKFPNFEDRKYYTFAHKKKGKKTMMGMGKRKPTKIGLVVGERS